MTEGNLRAREAIRAACSKHYGVQIISRRDEIMKELSFAEGPVVIEVPPSPDDEAGLTQFLDEVEAALALRNKANPA